MDAYVQKFVFVSNDHGVLPDLIDMYMVETEAYPTKNNIVRERCIDVVISLYSILNRRKIQMKKPEQKLSNSKEGLHIFYSQLI